MKPWMIVLAAAAFVALVVTWRLRSIAARARPQVAGGPEPVPAGAGADPLPTFNVVALGPRGSGKTLLLASMYHQLQTMSTRSYHVTAPFEQVLLLNQWFGEAADPCAQWPSGTAVASTRSFQFTLQTRGAAGRPLPVLALNYLEYAGGLLTEAQAPGSTAQAELLTQIRSAHALIGIIDGFWVRQLLDGHAEARVRLQQTVTTMINLMMSTECPITFVITKWDLLQDIDVDEEARLGVVRKHLMYNQGFRDLVHTHSQRRVVRLVPVSAVGPDFAELDPTGGVSKLPDGEIRPTNIDVPLAAVVPDLFEQIERSVGESELRAAVARVTRSGARRTAALAELAALLTETAGRVMAQALPPVGLVMEFADSLHRSPDLDGEVARSVGADRRLSLAEQQLEEDRAARRRVLRELQSRVDVLEGRLPSSRLVGEV